MRLTVAAVVTRESFAGVREFVRGVHDVMPDAAMFFSAMTPYGDPQSIASDPELLGRYARTMAELSHEHPLEVCGPGREEFFATKFGKADQLADTPCICATPIAAGKHVDCPRQLVWANMDPLGKVWYCRPHSFLQSHKERVERRMKAGKRGLAFRAALRAIDNLVLRWNNCRCYFPCNCEPYLDDIILHEEGRDLPGATANFLGRFTQEEIDEADALFHRLVGKGLSDPVKRVFLGDPAPLLEEGVVGPDAEAWLRSR